MIDVYIGEEPNDWLFSEVLRYSLSKQSTSTLTFHSLKYLPVKVPISITNGTILHRFYVPMINGYKDKVLFIDRNTLVRTDIAKYLAFDMEGKGALAPDATKLDFMVLDTPHLTHWDGDKIAYQCEDREVLKKTLLALPGGLVTDDIGLLPIKKNEIVFFKETPWKNENKLHPWFLEDLKSALLDKEIDPASIEREVLKGNLTPDIFKTLEA